MDDLILSAKPVELTQHPDYLEASALVCYYDAPNANGLQLSSAGAADMAKTLVNQPVDAKYRRVGGKDDLGAHEAYKDTRGAVCFATESVGTHTGVEIREADVAVVGGGTKRLPCLFAASRIWTRNKKLCAAVQRLFREGRLRSSYVLRIDPDGIEKKDGVEIPSAYSFVSNTLLGSQHEPAYPCAGVLALAEDSAAEYLSEALSEDMAAADGIEFPAENSAVVLADAAAPLTDRDIRAKLAEFVKGKLDWCEYAYLAFVFPVDGFALFGYEPRKSELDFVKAAFTAEGGAVRLTSGFEPVRLKADPVALSARVGELETEGAALKKSLEELQTANEKLQTDNGKLLAERVVEELKTRIDDTGLFAGKELAQAYAVAETGDKPQVDALIAAQAIAKAKKPAMRVPVSAAFEAPKTAHKNLFEDILKEV
jgi:hypothetical protein